MVTTMKILYICNLNNKSGGLYHATIERLKRISLTEDISVVNIIYKPSLIMRCLSQSKNLLKTSENSSLEGVEIKNFYTSHSIFSWTFKKIFPKKYYMWLANKLDAQLKKDNISFDIVHAHWGIPHGIIAKHISCNVNVPYYITFHGSDVLSLSNPKLKPILLNSMMYARKCFFVSKALMKSAVQMGYNDFNGVVSYNGVNEEFFNNNLINNNNNEFNSVAYIGSLELKKGADLLPAIFNKINEQIHTKFTVIGDGSLRKNLLEKMDKYNLDYKYLGNLDRTQLIEVLNNVSCLVVPSRTEGLGMVALEAHAMGIPVIGSNRGGIPEAIGDDRFLVDMDDNFTDNVAKRYMSLVNGSIKYSKEELKKRIKYSFSWDIVVRNEIKYMKEV